MLTFFLSVMFDGSRFCVVNSFFFLEGNVVTVIIDVCRAQILFMYKSTYNLKGS